MKQLIPNFTEAHFVEVSSDVHPKCGPLVLLCQRGASMSFQHSMTPAQALECAAALTAAAKSLTVQA